MESVIILFVFASFVISGTFLIRRNIDYFSNQRRFVRNVFFAVLSVPIPYFTALAFLGLLQLNIGKMHSPIIAFLFVVLFNILAQTFKEKQIQLT